MAPLNESCREVHRSPENPALNESLRRAVLGFLERAKEVSGVNFSPQCRRYFKDEPAILLCEMKLAPKERVKFYQSGSERLCQVEEDPRIRTGWGVILEKQPDVSTPTLRQTFLVAPDGTAFIWDTHSSRGNDSFDYVGLVSEPVKSKIMDREIGVRYPLFEGIDLSKGEFLLPIHSHYFSKRVRDKDDFYYFENFCIFKNGVEFLVGVRSVVFDEYTDCSDPSMQPEEYARLLQTELDAGQERMGKIVSGELPGIKSP